MNFFSACSRIKYARQSLCNDRLECWGNMALFFRIIRTRQAIAGVNIPIEGKVACVRLECYPFGACTRPPFILIDGEPRFVALIKIFKWPLFEVRRRQPVVNSFVEI